MTTTQPQGGLFRTKSVEQSIADTDDPDHKLRRDLGALDDDVHLGHLLHVPELAQLHRRERRLQRTAANVFVHHALVDYVVRVISATRRPAELGLNDVASWLSYGASPRATLGIVAACWAAVVGLGAMREGFAAARSETTGKPVFRLETRDR